MKSNNSISIVILTVLMINCFHLHAQKQMGKLSGELIIFHAGSLSVPIRDIAAAFNKTYPNVKIITESAGSVASARKITDLNKPCDIMASADYVVIDNMLVPRYADWNIKFATNEMTIAVSPKSPYANKINATNWYEILMKPDVSFGRSDPNSDPCGYRTLMMLQLAEKYYKKPGLAKNIMEKDIRFMRPKEMDLLALLETATIDFSFLYRSVSIQHKLKFIMLPDQVNLKNPALASQYAAAKVEINGNAPGIKQVMIGEPIIYGITIMRNAPNKAAAEAFLAFMLSMDKGGKIMVKDGQPSVIPMAIQNYDKLPAVLKPYAKKK